MEMEFNNLRLRLSTQTQIHKEEKLNLEKESIQKYNKNK